MICTGKSDGSIRNEHVVFQLSENGFASFAQNNQRDPERVALNNSFRLFE
jgi:hypothetical protein